jgi:glycosyltransferase involved in cell wall biosynthesis
MVCCLTSRGPLAAALEREGVPVYALGKRPGFDLSVVRGLVRVMREREVHIVHTHVWPADVWGRLSAKIARVAVLVTTEHSVDVWKKRPHLLVDWCLSKISDRIVCVSEAVRSFYSSRAGIRLDKLAVIHNGIDLSPFDTETDASLRGELGVPRDSPVCTVVARLLPEKGHRYFIEALSRIRRVLPSTVGLIVGDGPERKKLETLARNMHLNGGALKFLGQRRDVPEILEASDVFVLPSSVREGLSIALLEAMASRRAAVVTDVGGNRELIEDGITGVVVPPGNSDALAVGILKVLQDKSFAQTMVAAARLKVERQFGIQRMVTDTEILYSALYEQKMAG